MDTLREYLDFPQPLWRWLLRKQWMSVVAVLWCAYFAADSERSYGIWWLRLLLVSLFVALALFHVQCIARFVGFYRGRQRATRWWAEFQAVHRTTLAKAGVPTAAIDQIIEHLLDDDLAGAVAVAEPYLAHRAEGWGT